MDDHESNLFLEARVEISASSLPSLFLMDVKMRYNSKSHKHHVHDIPRP